MLDERVHVSTTGQPQRSLPASLGLLQYMLRQLLNLVVLKARPKRALALHTIIYKEISRLRLNLQRKDGRPIG